MWFRRNRGTVGSIIKERIIHWSTQHMKALGHMVSEKIFLCFAPSRPWGGARMDPRGTVGRIYKEDHYTLLHTKYERSGTCGFGEKDFFMFFPLYVYGSYLLPWKPEFQSDLAQNLMQRFPLLNDALDKI